MQALYFDGQDLILKPDVPRPERGAGEALIKTSLVGVCNTDLEIIKGYMGFTGVPGHEFVGVVEAADDPRLIGQRVVGDINAACGTCDTCQAGNPHHCPNRTVLGIQQRDGAFAEYLTLPAANLTPVPDEVSDEEAVFAEPLAAALEIPEQITLGKDDRVIVIGDGKLGLLIAQVMKLHSKRVTLLGRHAEKMAIAARKGVETALSDAFEERQCAEVVVDVTGSSRGLEQAIELVRPRGTIVLKSTVADRYEINLAPLVIHEVNIVGSRCGPMARAVDVLRDKAVDVTSMIQSRYPLSQGVEAFKEAQRKGSLKVLVKPDGA